MPPVEGSAAGAGEMHLTSTAAQMRDEFDGAFAVAVAAAEDQSEDYLAIRVGAVRYALRLADLAGLHRDRTVVPVNARTPGLLGMAGFRGKMASIHDLGPLLGQPAQANPRWVVLCRGPLAVGLAFEGFEAHLRLPLGQVVPAQTDNTAPHVSSLLQTADSVRPLINVPSLLAVLGKGDR